ncbi:mercuric reductase [Sulfurivirga caldicuralii]|uniref:Mercuric reductase n=1 Tax=Sulfurivirga caldicuralii TaxID=364032 RepID=A0A1N6DNH1_9GAMM|nr:mercury(II) reductase [Sulfurivirga caldicuralii]SIN72359.1 mercuric reductase [Sulfurivirga caldicuralii]
MSCCKENACTQSSQHVLIIGTGSAAFAAAIEIVENGGRATLIEAAEQIGGTCVNVGCVPSKILIRQAQLNHWRRHTPFDGLPACEAEGDRRVLIAQLKARVDELRHAKYEKMLDTYPGIKVVHGHARFLTADTLVVEKPDGSRQQLRGDGVLIATGSRPHIPEVEGLAATPYWTSTEALFSEETPPRMIVLGAGVVALELAQAYQRLGTQVTLLARRGLLTNQPAEVGDTLRQALKAEGMNILTRTQPQRVEHAGGIFQVQTPAGVLQAERLLVATGRQPNTDVLALEQVGVRIDSRGQIVVDEQLRTSVPGVWAAGDCTQLPKFVYVAAASGRIAASAMRGGCETLDLSVLPQVVFTDPQVATVGLSEDEAQAQGIKAISRRLPLDQVPRALANFETTGFVQLVAEAGSMKLLGAQIVAPEAGEMIEAVAIALRKGLRVQDLAGELMAYLTWNEALKLCAQTFFKDVNKLSCCAG